MKIYLAGPDVFRKDAIEYGQQLKAICVDHGHIGLFPMDNEVNFKTPYPYKIARQIFTANAKMIQQSDIVIANLNPFRGPSADVGTVWEVGYAIGLGKKVYGYRYDRRPYNERVLNPVNGVTCTPDSTYPNVEDFGLGDNLMIDCSVEMFLSFEAVLKHLTLIGR